MKSKHKNGIATAADFRLAAEAQAFGEPERVRLPASGLTVVLRRPRAQAFIVGQASLPQGVAAALLAADPGKPPSAEEAVGLANFWRWMFARMFVTPRLSLNPGPDEVHPDLITQADQEFLFRWAKGEVAPGGSDLRKFRGAASRRSADPGKNGTDAGSEDAQRDRERTDA